MSVDRQEVDRIARLAKLRLDDDEAERLVREMSRILEHVERLQDEAGTGAGDEARGGAVPFPAPGAETPARQGAGTRDPEAESPDPLRGKPATFAPRMEHGLFVVPPPPGVVAEAHEEVDPVDGG